MRRASLLLAACLLGGAGCVTGTTNVTEGMKGDAGLAKRMPAAPVTADRVTAQNAHKQSQALADELDRETQDELTATVVGHK